MVTEYTVAPPGLRNADADLAFVLAAPAKLGFSALAEGKTLLEALTAGGRFALGTVAFELAFEQLESIKDSSGKLKQVSDVAILATLIARKRFDIRGARWLLGPKTAPNSDIITVYRGMTKAEFDKLLETLTLESKAMRSGLDTPPSYFRALWHPFTSNCPKSPFVSTTTIPGIARRIFARRPGDVVAEIKISRSALIKSINVPEAEYLAKGGTRIISIQLAASDATASGGAVTLWVLESTALLGGYGFVVFEGISYLVKIIRAD